MMQWQGDRPWNPVRIEACAEKWRTWNQRWIAFRGRLPTDRRLELAYEQLTRKQVRRLADWTGTDVARHKDMFAARPPGEALENIPQRVRDMWRETDQLIER